MARKRDTILTSEEIRLRWWLKHIRDIAACSDGVEFYAMLADRALRGDPAIDDIGVANG